MPTGMLTKTPYFVLKIFRGLDSIWDFNPISGGALKTPYSGVNAILHTPPNFWTTDDKELKSYMIIDTHKLLSNHKGDNYAIMPS